MEKKPAPEARSIYTCSLLNTLDYLNTLRPGIKERLLKYWTEKGAFSPSREFYRLTIPTEWFWPIGALDVILLKKEYPNLEEIYWTYE